MPASPKPTAKPMTERERQAKWRARQAQQIADFRAALERIAETRGAAAKIARDVLAVWLK